MSEALLTPPENAGRHRPDLPKRSRALDNLTWTERAWEICHVEHHDTVLEQRLINAGWEPYGADLMGKHFRKRVGRMERAVVIGRHPSSRFKPLCRDLFEDWHVIVAVRFHNLLQRQPDLNFHRIVMAWRPQDPAESRWVDETVKPRLIFPAQLEWLY